MFGAEPDTAFPFEDEDYIRLWVADMAFSTPPPVLDAIRQRLDRKILGYTKIYDDHYYEVLEDWFDRRYNWKIDRQEIVTSPGVVAALNRLVSLLTQEDESVLIVTPSYAPFKRAGDYNNRRVVTSDLIDTDGYYEMDFDDIRSKIEDVDLKIKVFILCHPHNPTGRIWMEEELLKLGRICLENNVWLISDEIHADLLRKGKRHVPLATLFPDTDKIITCTAPSKTFNLAGNMLSHIFIKNEGARAIWKKYYEEYHSPLSFVAAQAAYEKSEDWLEQLKDYVDDNLFFLKESLADLLPNAKFRIPEATYLAWVDLTAYMDRLPTETNLTKFFAMEAGVLVEGGDMFIDNGFGHIRINVACPRAVLIEGVSRIVKALLGLG